ncbi:TIGR02234 family membrane protein [Rhodococcoides fascians]|uniref:TIGR02234 family membrane protein n=1 Tax=Rhodococcoides fascians TaxID=1828 RepID=UPI00056C5BA8|nr:TIGR02234 family membrane protein [Rhodococcus fascians]
MTAAPASGTGRPAKSRAAAIPVVAMLVGALCLWGSSRMTWVHVISSDGLGEDRATDLLGSTWAAASTPLALALVAAVAASFAVRGWASRVLAVLVGLVAVGAGIPALQALVSDVSEARAADLAELPGRADVVGAEAFTLPAVVALVGALCAALAAVMLLRKPTARKVLSSKYDAPAARREEVARRASAAASSATDRAASNDEGEDLTERMLWDALDAGEDPTDPSGTRRKED